MRKPDFFIVGAPKCGTTAMNAYLKQHPEIFIPDAKELHFFGSDLRPSSYRRDEAKYLAHFSGCRGEKRAGEASVWYLASGKAASEIKAFSPSSDIIIMLRNPVDMLYAHYYQFLYNAERLPPFEEALAREDERKREYEDAVAKGKYLGNKIIRIFHTHNAAFTGQVERYFDIFGKEHVHVIIYDDLKADAAGVYGGVLRFLGVDPDYAVDFKVINPSKRPRIPALQKLLKSPRVQTAGRWLLPRPLGLFLLKNLKVLNTEYAPRPLMSPVLRRRLQERFEPEVQSLGVLLGRDLTHWSRD